MQKLNQTVLITGVLAGICAAFLTLGATAQSSFSFLLYAGSAMPIFIAGMGWGNRAAVVAIITTAIIGALVISPLFSLTIAIFTLIPAGWLSHLANLARPASELGGPDDLLAWYPLSGIVLHLCLLVSVAVVILGWMIGYGPDLVARMVDLMMTSVQSREPLFEPNVEALAQTKSLLVLMLPIVQRRPVGHPFVCCLLFRGPAGRFLRQGSSPTRGHSFRTAHAPQRHLRFSLWHRRHVLRGRRRDGRRSRLRHLRCGLPDGGLRLAAQTRAWKGLASAGSHPRLSLGGLCLPAAYHSRFGIERRAQHDLPHPNAEN
ncbi:hypothetical protein QE432_003725 [Agrobacterium sp. SORGH_AS 745]|nr:hypothetical protein [Agrobacterium sp. SORGH_AS_0745]